MVIGIYLIVKTVLNFILFFHFDWFWPDVILCTYTVERYSGEKLFLKEKNSKLLNIKELLQE